MDPLLRVWEVHFFVFETESGGGSMAAYFQEFSPEGVNSKYLHFPVTVEIRIEPREP
jgi:hypothetical protein